MKSFLQYITEDMPVETGYSLRASGGRSHVSKTPRQSKSTLLGKIGPYEVHHHARDDEDGPTISIRHKGVQVGEMGLTRTGKHVEVSEPMMVGAHRGKKALVKNLVPKVYSMIADKIAPVQSGEIQTGRGRSVWRRLSSLRPLKIHSPYSVERFTHPNHPTLALHDVHFDDYVDAHGGGIWSEANLKQAKRILAKNGMSEDSLAKIKKIEHLPNPDEFKRTFVNPKNIDRYDPAKHDSFVYSNADDMGSGSHIVLRTQPKGRKSSK